MKSPILFLLIFHLSLVTVGQGFLRTEGKSIVDPDGEEVLLRGMGLGGWMLMEGYMMQSSDVADTQHEFEERLVALMGQEKTDEFFDAWLANHVTRADIDSLASWGFNSVRLPMHYNLFTLPVEEEPVEGEHTWLSTGFDLVDSLLGWCQANNMYLVLDLHAAPGGQGANAAISDYDPDKPSLWESKANRDKTVALWKKLAERYKDEEWIGGYDLINEPNWDLPGGTLLRALYKEITDSIRAVGDNHILFIEGNWWANDFTGLTPPWDDNMVYSFHKYWSHNDPGSIQWVLDIREDHNVPLWMGEGGENSNTWFHDAIKLFEDNNIGWSWWPMKRIETIVSPFSIIFSDGYRSILAYWGSQGPRPTADEAFEAMMELAKGTNSKHNLYRKDVHDAMIRQVKTNEIIPYKLHSIPGVLHMSDFDLGKNNMAYYDVDVANYALSTGQFQAWNSGWVYRNDGVDIEANNDIVNSNGFHVAFVKKGEWMNYTVDIAESGSYTLDVRVAAIKTGGKFHLSLDGEDITTSQTVNSTGDWQKFETMNVSSVPLEAGKHVITFHIDNEDEFNISSIEFARSGSIDMVPFGALSGYTGADERSIEVMVSHPVAIESLVDVIDNFSLMVNNVEHTIEEIRIMNPNERTLIITLSGTLLSTDEIVISYSGDKIRSKSNKTLEAFTDLSIRNNLNKRHTIPGRLQVEDFQDMVGLQTEPTSDTGGGLNIGYTDPGDYADYLINVEQDGNYTFNLRLAGQSKVGKVGFYLLEDGDEVELFTMDTPITFGWQRWETKSANVFLPGGFHTLRMKVLSSGFNINWVEIEEVVLGIDPDFSGAFYPNPTSGEIHVPNIEFDQFDILSLHGSIIYRGSIPKNGTLDLRELNPGLYILRMIKAGTVGKQQKILIVK